jgi:hypothetical protein
MDAKQRLEEIVPISLLGKVSKIWEMGADAELINILLKKANHPLSLDEIIGRLRADSFREVYAQLGPELQHDIDVLLTTRQQHTFEETQKLLEDFPEVRRLFRNLCGKPPSNQDDLI